MSITAVLLSTSLLLNPFSHYSLSPTSQTHTEMAKMISGFFQYQILMTMKITNGYIVGTTTDATDPLLVKDVSF